MGRGNPDISKYAVKFGSGQDPTRGGRPKKIYTILKEKGFCKDDITTAFGELAFYKLEELEAVHDNEEMPVIARIIAKQFYTALKDCDWHKIKDLMDHVIGRPTSNKKDNSSINEPNNMKMFNFKIGHKPLKKKKES
jgi:hypothetical protein